MARYALIAVLVLLTAAPGWAVEDAKQASNLPSSFPTYVWLDAYGEEPAEYSYWTSGSSSRNRNWHGDFTFPERGTCCPSILREVKGPGRQYATFNFYDDKDNLIKSVHRCIDVDEYGLPGLCIEGYDDWHFNSVFGVRHYSGYGYLRNSYNDSEPAEKSLYEYPWPKVELTAKLHGAGPWTAECAVDGNIPAQWFLSYEWDLNHDGSFNRTTGRRPSLTCDLTKPGRYIFTVRATDMRGYTTTAEAEFTVP